MNITNKTYLRHTYIYAYRRVLLFRWLTVSFAVRIALALLLSSSLLFPFFSLSDDRSFLSYLSRYSFLAFSLHSLVCPRSLTFIFSCLLHASFFPSLSLSAPLPLALPFQLYARSLLFSFALFLLISSIASP